MQYNLGWATAAEIRYGDGDGNDQPRSVQVRITQVGIPDPLSKEFTITQNSSTITTGDNSPYYQWGRKDPMPPGDGINNGAAGERVLEFGMQTDGNSRYTFVMDGGRAGAMNIGVQNPNIFYLLSNGSWYDGAYVNLWDSDNTTVGAYTWTDNNATKTVYDPNPVGWKMPPINAWTGFMKTSVTSTNSNASQSNVDGAFSGGWRFWSGLDGTGSSIFYPALGHRFSSDGKLYNIPAYGHYWSAMLASAGSGYTMRFNVANIEPFYTGVHSNGFSVRPVRDETPQQAQP
jgi:uncharacterized protein (TIGR02145 family)